MAVTRWRTMAVNGIFYCLLSVTLGVLRTAEDSIGFFDPYLAQLEEDKASQQTRAEKQSRADAATILMQANSLSQVEQRVGRGGGAGVARGL